MRKNVSSFPQNIIHTITVPKMAGGMFQKKSRTIQVVRDKESAFCLLVTNGNGAGVTIFQRDCCGAVAIKHYFAVSCKGFAGIVFAFNSK